jgi:shikimate dehydrogenase
MTDSDRYAVFGNPVKHSRSPQIHAAFAAQCEQKIQYRAVCVEEGEFAGAAARFFEDGGRGLNITLPFKRDAFDFADELTPRAQKAGAVNTLSLTAGGGIAGDNTDGVGLIRDLIANLGWSVAGQRVLLIGAGGAVRGVLEPLLRERPAQILVANRTVDRAEQLARDFAALGPVSGGGFDCLQDQEFDLLINGTSASLGGELPPLPDTLMTERSRCYDMMYGAEPTVFMRWAAQHTAWAVSDGLGMLVEQAAESFYIWRQQRPQTGPVIAQLRTAMAGD